MEYRLVVIFSSFLFLAVDSAILLNTFRHKDGSDNQKRFKTFNIFTVLQQAFAILNLIAYPIVWKTPAILQYFFYIGLFCTMSLCSMYWYLYLRALITENSKVSIMRMAMLSLPIVILAVACLASPVTHWVFYIAADGEYQRGSLVVLQIAVPYFYAVLAIIMGIVTGRKGNKARTEKMVRYFLVFAVPSIFCAIIQMFIVQGGFTAIGISMGLILMYLELYVEDAKENMRLKTVDIMNQRLSEVNQEQEAQLEEIKSLNSQLEEKQALLEESAAEQESQLEEITKLNAEMEIAVQNAQAANNAKSTFLFNMSHDIRTPMNAILGFTELMKKEENDPMKVEDYRAKIEESGQYLLSIINNVLDMARVESGKIVLDEDVMDLENEDGKGMDVLRSDIERKNLTFTHHQNIRNRFVIADRTRMTQILINLLSNAVKYTPDGGHIDLSTKEIPCDREGYATYVTSVSDTGIGMSKEFQEQIFDSFSRERNTTESKVAGTGLGMAIVKKLIDLMGGTIEVESEPGKGSKFTVTLTLKIAQKPGLESEKAEEREVSLEGKRILLAEDNELNAEIAIAILEELGFQVERAEDGVQCIDMLRKADAGYFDLILMDIQMPNLDGYRATEKIRQLSDAAKANIPILAMTANAFEEDKREALRAGMNGHLAKPINVPELMKALAGILG